MRTRSFVATGVTVLFFAGAAQASTAGPYLSGDVGVSLQPNLSFKSDTFGPAETSTDPGFNFGGAAGYDLGNGLRFQLSSDHTNNQVSKLNGDFAAGHLSSTSLMLGAQYDLVTGSDWAPYVGAGIGGVNFGGDVAGYSDRAWKPAYQLEAGLRKDLSRQLSLYGGYRFTQAESIRMDDPSIPDTASQHFSKHAIVAGLTYHFGQ